MKFRVIFREASCTAQSPVRIVEESTGHEIGWANRYLDREYVRRSADKTLQLMLTICCILSVGGPVSITPVTFKKVIFQKQPYRTTSDFNPVLNPYLRAPPSTPALELSIVLFAASFPMGLVKSPLVFISVTCGDHRWGSPGRVW